MNTLNDDNKDRGNDLFEEPLLPPVNEFRRFRKVFFQRKIVRVSSVLFLLILFIAVFADLIAPYGENDQDLYATLADPGISHLLGTDSLGRDLFSRLLFGSRIALMVGVFTSIVDAVLGTLIGLVAGYVGGIVQSVIMRITDAMMAIPNLILSLLIIAALKAGIPGVVLAVSLAMLPGYIRLINGQVLSVKQNDYILAERVIGARKPRILFRHIFPNITSPLIVMMTMTMGGAIMAEAALSFLGIGITPPLPAWGSMCYDGFEYLTVRPLLSIVPGLMIMVLVFSLNMLGDGLRDALDPKLRGTTSE
ncbi:MAG: ABC transporter permease [Clostridiales Family XIII bacterium]|jgi:ABC-type dipeptide/oligopeptide/nickel transport system permease subunit|nr:ABC transporter permease [Clostridiales Family XIII bacterium]